jgi:ligand-binding sensor domain-containing protein
MEQNGFQPIAMAFGFNESTNTFKKITGSDTKFTFSNVRTVAIDTRNQLWIGTTKGLRVLPNVGNFKRKTK